ncbi:MAG: IPExxxVDY family protein [Bacteroidetes bacterium]|nr:IPExxxVDY family protein [Bacteroidota bacterium]
MAKRKRLDIDFSFDFQLYGIISTLKPFKLVWEINRAAGKNLVKMPDFEIESKAGSRPYVYYASPQKINMLRLFKNKPTDESRSRELLVPEHPHFDYILLQHGEAFEESNRLQELLRNIPSVELTAFIPLAALKSKEHFIF